MIWHPANPKQRPAKPFLWASLALLVGSNLLPALRLIEHPISVSGPRFQTMMGWELTVLGWMGPLSGHFGWYANPLTLLGLLLAAFRCRGISRFVMTLAVLAALSSFSLIVMGLPKNEGGVGSLGFSAFLPGFYLWFVAHFAGWVGAMIGLPPKAPPLVAG